MPRRHRLAAALLPTPLPEHRAGNDGGPARQARQAALERAQHLPHVHANGIDIHYTVEGAGPPVVMLHGATSAALDDWSAQRPLFRKAFRIYLVDARGHGGTKWDVRDGFTRDMMVDDLLG